MNLCVLPGIVLLRMYARKSYTYTLPVQRGNRKQTYLIYNMLDILFTFCVITYTLCTSPLAIITFFRIASGFNSYDILELTCPSIIDFKSGDTSNQIQFFVESLTQWFTWMFLPFCSYPAFTILRHTQLTSCVNRLTIPPNIISCNYMI